MIIQVLFILQQALSKFGQILRDLGKYQEAIEYFEKALVIVLKNHGPKHPSVSSFLNYLGTVWRPVGGYQKAKGGL